MTRTPLLFLLAALNAAVLAGCKGANRGATGDDTLGTPSGAVTSDTTMRTDTGTGARSDTALRAAPGTQTGPRPGQTRDTAK
jgi:hypothetical protein